MIAFERKELICNSILLFKKLLLIFSFLYSVTIFGQSNYCTLNIQIKLPEQNNINKSVILYISNNGLSNYDDTTIIKPQKINFTKKIVLKEPKIGNFYLLENNKIISSSNVSILTNEIINVVFYEGAGKVKVNNAQNIFLQKNRYNYLSLPSNLSDEPGFKPSLCKTSYDLNINYDKYKLFVIWKEYEEYVKDQVLINRKYFNNLKTLYEIRNQISTKTLEDCYKIVYPYFKNASLTKELKRYIENSKILLIGKLPDFSVVDSLNVLKNSKDIINSQKITLIEIWASWCTPSGPSLQ